MRPNGGPAYPNITTGPKYTERGTPYGEQIYSVGGMTLRDYFAGQALAGIMQYDSTGLTVDGVVLLNAKNAYRLADAMIAEREANRD